MNGVTLVVSLAVVAVILYIVWKILTFLFYPALILFGIAFVIYYFSGVNIFKGLKKDDDKKNDK